MGLGSGMEIGDRMHNSAAISAVNVILCTFVFIGYLVSLCGDIAGRTALQCPLPCG